MNTTGTLSAVFTISLLGAASVYGFLPRVPTVAHSDDVGTYEICFRPGPISCSALVVKEIDSAARTIDFEAYSLTDMRIVDALNRAAARGVKVRSVVDRESVLAKMLPGEILVDCTVRIHHSKTVIIDNESVATGSFNFTHSAEIRNTENHIWIHDATVAAAYTADFEAQVLRSIPGTKCPEGARR